MTRYLFLIVMLCCCGGLFAQTTAIETGRRRQAAREKQPAAAKQSAPDSQEPAAARQNASAAKKEAARAAEPDSEEAGVVIDSKSEDTEAEPLDNPSRNSGEQPEEPAFNAYLPASYGPLKGIASEQGRDVLVFENEDGVLSFVQFTVGKNSASWKLLARVARSQD